MLRVLLDLLALSTNLTLASACPKPRCSNNAKDDADLCVPALIKKYNYPIEVHHVTTKDGYILELHRIPHGRDGNNDSNKTLPVALMVPGLFGSSAMFVLPGPEAGCGYRVADAGFDAWLANLRGTTYSDCHKNLSRSDTQFWKFSWEQNGQFDLTAIIDYILKLTGQKKLHYLGHSMGTTAFFVMGSLLPEYNMKISSMNALAPVAYMEHVQNLFLKLLSQFADSLAAVSFLIGKGEFLSNPLILKLAGQVFCRDEAITQPICSSILFLISGWNEKQHNATLLPIILGHTPAGASVGQLTHYAQQITDKLFRRYDYGSEQANKKEYGSSTPPNYELSKITAPVYLHYSDDDQLATAPDVQRLSKELGNLVKMYKVPIKFTHLDFLWGINATIIFDKVIDIMWSTENGEEILDDNHYDGF